MPSPVSGHTAPSFPRFPGPSFQPPIPSACAPFGLGPGAQLHPAAAFPGDTCETISERPKKVLNPLHRLNVKTFMMLLLSSHGILSRVLCLIGLKKKY